VHGVLGVEFDTGRVELDYRKEKRSSSRPSGDLALAFDHTQIVSTPIRESVLSLDARTGEVLWTLEGNVPGRSGKSWSVSSLSTPASDSIFLIDRRRDVFELDVTGQVTHRYATDEQGGIKGPILINGVLAFKERKGDQGLVMKVLSREGDTVLLEEPGCKEVFSMSSTHLGCVGFDRLTQQVIVRRMRPDGAERVAHTLTASESTSRLIHAMALSSRHVALVTSSSRETEDGSSMELRDVYIVDMERPEVMPVHVEVPRTQKSLGSSLLPSLSFTPDGVILLADWGGFHAIQTNIPWTNRGPAPRGPELADHQNSGYLPFVKEP